MSRSSPAPELVVEGQKNVPEEGLEQQQKKVTTELRIQGETMLEGCSNIPPSLPIEVIEKILQFTFLRPSKLTPSSDPLPLLSTSHLLLVSKGFRELCLPLFYQSITITEPSHYTTFFDPENGLFVAGEEGRRRWSFVRELAIVSGIEPPVGSFYDDSGAYLVPMVVPSDHELDVVCILEGGEDPVDWRDGDNLDQLVENLEQDEDLWEEALDDVRDEFKVDFGHPRSMDELNWLGEILEVPSLDSEIQERLRTRTIHRIEAEHRAFFRTLVEGLRPAALRFPADALQPDLPDDDDEPTTMGTTLLQIYRPSSPSKQSSSADLFGAVALFLWTLTFRRIHLEGFDPSFVAELTGWIKANLESDELSPASTSPHNFVTWSWELEDGTLFSLSARPTSDVA